MENLAAKKVDKFQKHAKAPRYQELTDLLAKEIAEGIHPVGQNLPTELELCKRFSTSRFTVREALRQLIDSGIIIRRQGSGSRVISKIPSTLYVQNLNSIDELLQYSSDTKLEMQHSEIIDATEELAKTLECQKNQKWLKIQTVRVAPQQSPICWTNIFVSPEHSDLINHLGIDGTPVYSVLCRLFDLDAYNISLQMFAGSMDETRSWIMGVEPNSPTLIIIRKYKDKNGKLFEVSISEHPAGRFTFSAHMERTSRID